MADVVAAFATADDDLHLDPYDSDRDPVAEPMPLAREAMPSKEELRRQPGGLARLDREGVTAAAVGALRLALPAVFAVALSAACAPSAPGKSELQSYSCDFPDGETGAPGRGAVEIRNGEVQSVAVETSFPGLPGKWGYSCWLSATRVDSQSTWKRHGLVTTVEFTDDTAWHGDDYARLIPISGGYRIDLRNTTPSRKCGAGAGLPREIVIIGAGKQCKTVWEPALP